MKRVYISGPITGLPDLNKHEFNKAALNMTLIGVDYFNPQDIPPPKENLEGKALWRYYMRECVKELPSCSHIFMLRGWYRSEGATEEHRIAKMLGLLIEYQEA